MPKGKEQFTGGEQPKSKTNKDTNNETFTPHFIDDVRNGKVPGYKFTNSKLVGGKNLAKKMDNVLKQVGAKEQKTIISPNEQRFLDLAKVVSNIGSEGFIHKHIKELTYTGSDKNIITTIVSNGQNFISISKIKDLVPKGKEHNISNVSLVYSGKGQFKAHTKEYDEKSNTYQTSERILTGNEVGEYLDAIQNRIKDYKKKTKAKFIELSVNQDKQEADNLLEHIEEQTA